MPELPEVETVVRGLRDTILGRTIVAVTSRAPKACVLVSRSLGRGSISTHLRNRTIESVDRRGKNILIALSGDLTLWVHLKMTGKFRYIDNSLPVAKHDLFVVDFTPDTTSDNQHLRFNDMRRFGRWRLFPNDELWQQPGLAELGPEPLEITAQDFAALCRRRPRMFKPALLDQSFLAGLGNIYADESLYATRIHPKRLTTTVSKPKLIELHGHIQRLLQRSIDVMGTSVDTYSGVNGQPGTFQNYLLAYNHEGAPCHRCGTKIKREKIGSRSAHYCPKCQRPR